jgi:formylglycine-generating enzyme required for sulfatase activity
MLKYHSEIGAKESERSAVAHPGTKAAFLAEHLHGRLRRLGLALSARGQVRYSLAIEEAERTPWRRLDYVPAPVAVPLALLIGLGSAWVAWTLPAMLAAPVFLLFLAGGAALAFRGEPVLVSESPAVPEHPSLVPEDWWVDIPAGSYRMGSPENEPARGDNEGPVHEVRVSAFRCLRYPVTQGIERRLTGDRQAALGRGDPPLVHVSWLDAVRLCNRLSEAESLTPCYRFEGQDEVVWDRAAEGYRLLTEAEWEYACRAGTETRWSFGDDEAQLGAYAWYSRSSGVELHPVGEKRPNPWGLHDMHGLVFEWCWDWYGPYADAPQTDPAGPRAGDSRVLRGGSFFIRAEDTRSAIRFRDGPEDRFGDIGFRCARAPRRQP